MAVRGSYENGLLKMRSERVKVEGYRLEGYTLKVGFAFLLFFHPSLPLATTLVFSATPLSLLPFCLYPSHFLEALFHFQGSILNSTRRAEFGSSSSASAAALESSIK